MVRGCSSRARRTTARETLRHCPCVTCPVIYISRVHTHRLHVVIRQASRFPYTLHTSYNNCLCTRTDGCRSMQPHNATWTNVHCVLFELYFSVTISSELYNPSSKPHRGSMKISGRKTRVWKTQGPSKERRECGVFQICHPRTDSSLSQATHRGNCCWMYV